MNTILAVFCTPCCSLGDWTPGGARGGSGRHRNTDLTTSWAVPGALSSAGGTGAPTHSVPRTSAFDD